MTWFGVKSLRYCGVDSVVLTAAFSILVYTQAVGFAAETVATPEPEQPGDAERERLLSSKLRLLGLLVNASDTAVRIEKIGDAEAKASLNEAILAYREAERLLASAQWENAEQQLDSGLKAVSAASRRVIDSHRAQQLNQAHYQTLLQRVLSFREAFERIILEKEVGPKNEFLDQSEVESSLRQAEDFANQGRYGQANAHLSHAAELLAQALSDIRHEETLVHELIFASPLEEFSYEQQRNQSYLMMIELVKSKGKWPEAKLSMIDGLVVENETLSRQAEALAEQGKTDEAIQKLENGTEQLVRALRLAGMALP